MRDDLLHDPRVTLWGLLLEVHAELRQRLEPDIKNAAGVPATWFEVMLRVARTPGGVVRMTHLAEMVSFTSGGFSKLAERMEAAGVICREPDPRDGRAALVRLTSEGEAALERGLQAHLPSLQRHLNAHLTERQSVELTRALRRLRDALRTP